MTTLYRLQSIFREVLDEPALRVTATTTVANLPEWDSVAMVQIVLAAEAEFGVRFTTDEVAELRSVADIMRILEGRAP